MSVTPSAVLVNRNREELRLVSIVLSLDPVAAGVLTAALAAAVGAVVKVLVERALSRWVPEPRLAKPEPEYIL